MNSRNRLSRTLVTRLEEVVGRGCVISDEPRLSLYRETRGDRTAQPSAVVLPATDSEVADILRLLGKEGFSASVRGGGSGLSWGALPPDGVVVLSTARMTQPLMVLPDRMHAAAGAGVRIEELLRAAAQNRLRLRGSMDSPVFGTVGGFVARNGDGQGGSFGLADNFVSGLRCVYANGDAIESSPTGTQGPGDVNGFALGSEGTLCVVTEASFRLSPDPERELVLVALFPDPVAATIAGVSVLKTGLDTDGIDVAGCEVVERALSGEIAAGSRAALLVCLSGGVRDVEENAQWAAGVCHDHLAAQVLTVEGPQRNELARSWRQTVQALNGSPHATLLDFSCPASSLTEFASYTFEEARERGIPLTGVIRVASECLLMISPSVLETGERNRAFAVCMQEKALALRGSAVAVHGVGARRLESLPQLHRENDLDAMRRIESVLDKRHVLSLSLPPTRNAERRDVGQRKQRETAIAEIRRRTAEIVNKASLGPPAVPAGISSPENLGLFIRSAREHNVAVSIGGIPGSAQLNLDLSAMNRVVLSDAASRAVVVEAGVTIGALGQHLTPLGLCFPTSPYIADELSVGDLLAWEVTGAFALGFRPIRERVLGLEAVTGRGDVLSWGGMVHMQHAGLRLAELCLGKRNRYAITTAVALRVTPAPAARNTVVSSFRSLEAAAGFARALVHGGHGSAGHMNARAVAFCSGTAAGKRGGAASVVVEFAGTLGSVEACSNRATVLAAVEGGENVEVSEGQACETLWKRFAGWYRPLPVRDSGDDLHLVLFTSGESLAFCVDHLVRATSRQGKKCRFLADASAARADFSIPGGKPILSNLLASLDENLAGVPFRAEVFSPFESPGDFEARQESFRLAEELKQQFDPNGVLPSGLLASVGF